MPLHNDIPPLILKRLQEVITPEEEALLEAWAATDPENRALLERLQDEPQIMADAKTFDELWAGDRGRARYDRMERAVLTDTAVPVKKLWRHWLPYTAAAILLVTVGMWLFFDGITDKHQAKIAYANDIAPGGNRATLTLADGRTMDLSEAQTGIVINDDDITYNDGASLVVISREAEGRQETSPLVLTTPRGGTYQIILSDGTKVWLNSASTLKYPSVFDGDERVVELIGEAYFDVAKAEGQKDKKTKEQRWPFRVTSAGHTVEVLGTEFNIAAYPDESEVKTTLVEGSVQIASTIDHQSPVTLIPGQQSTSTSGQIVVNTVDIEQYIAWKEGFFYFNGDSPQEAFAQLSRWYNIELAYPGKVPIVQFYGKIERDKSLGSLLKILERAGLEFEVVPKGNGSQLILGRE